MLRLLLTLAAALCLIGCRGEAPPADPTPQADAAATPTLSPEEIVDLARQLEGRWRLLLTEQEERQRRDALDHVSRLGDSPHAREMRAALQDSYDNGMTVTDSTIALHLIRQDVALTWTLVQDTPGLFSIETLDAQGRRQTFDVSFDGRDRVTLTGRGAGPVSRFERMAAP